MEIEEAARRLRMIVRSLNRQSQADTGPTSPTRSQQAILAWLQELGPLTASALAVAEHITAQSVSQTVDALVALGWAKRRRDRRDRRCVMISITDPGRQALERGRALRQALLVEAITTRLDPHERDQLFEAITLFERLVDIDPRTQRATAPSPSAATHPGRGVTVSTSGIASQARRP